MSRVDFYEGDNRITLRRLIDEGVRVHSVITDPPYGLVSVTKRFGGEKAAPAKFGKDGAFSRASRGFMSCQWDGTGIERDPEFWALIWEILLPGGYCLAFSSPRTGHWQACAMETAGFVMHPFLGWTYSQGFPKAHNAAMAIDKALGVEGSRGAPKTAAHAGWIERGKMRGDDNNEGWQRPWMQDAEKVAAAAAAQYIPGSREAAQWDGWAYGAQSLKPALEPIYVGQKPFSEKTGAANLLKHEVGALNIDGCRVPVTGESRAREGESSQDLEYGDTGSTNFTGKPGIRGGSPLGRHPANLLHDNSPEVVAMFPITTSGTGAVKRKSARENEGNTGAAFGAESRAEGTEMVCYGDTGRASRVFNSFPLDTDPLFYHPKATKKDRAGSHHPTVKPITLMQWLCRLATPPGGIILDPFAGSGTTGEAAKREGFDCILMEAEPAYAADIRQRFGIKSELTELTNLLGPVEGSMDLSILG